MGFRVPFWAGLDAGVELVDVPPNGRVMSRRMLFDVDMARVGWSGGTKIPSCRKDFTFDMRIRLDAEGERRIIGSGEREEAPFRGSGRPAEGPGIPLWAGFVGG